MLQCIYSFIKPWGWRLLQIEYLKNPEADTCYNVYILILTTLKLTLVTMYIFFYQILRLMLVTNSIFKNPWSWRLLQSIYQLPWSWRLLQVEYLENPECIYSYIKPWSCRLLQFIYTHINYPEADTCYPEADACYNVYILLSYPEADACYKLNI